MIMPQSVGVNVPLAGTAIVPKLLFFDRRLLHLSGLDV